MMLMVSTLCVRRDLRERHIAVGVVVHVESPSEVLEKVVVHGIVDSAVDTIVM